MKKLFLITMAVLMVASVAFGAAGYRHTITIPADKGAATDSAWADVTGADEALDLLPLVGSGAKGFRLRTMVVTEDADIDSIAVLTRFSPDGINWVVVDSQEITGSTAASGCTKYYSTDSLSCFRYLQQVARVFGDAAGSATQTITVGSYLYVYNGTGEWIRNYEWPRFTTSFAE